MRLVFIKIGLKKNSFIQFNAHLNLYTKDFFLIALKRSFKHVLVCSLSGNE